MMVEAIPKKHFYCMYSDEPLYCVNGQVPEDIFTETQFNQAISVSATIVGYKSGESGDQSEISVGYRYT